MIINNLFSHCYLFSLFSLVQILFQIDILFSCIAMFFYVNWYLLFVFYLSRICYFRNHLTQFAKNHNPWRNSLFKEQTNPTTLLPPQTENDRSTIRRSWMSRSGRSLWVSEAVLVSPLSAWQRCSSAELLLVWGARVVLVVAGGARLPVTKGLYSGAGDVMAALQLLVTSLEFSYPETGSQARPFIDLIKIQRVRIWG